MRIFRYATLFKYPLFAIALACIPCYSLFSQPCNGPTVKPTINISANATTVCSGSLITFIATATNCGASPTYQWKINGISTGANKDTFVTASVNNGDVVSCLLTVDPAFVCASPAKVSSYGIVMTVSPSQAPTITIAASANDICPGSSVTFNSKTESTGANLSFQWKLNGKNVSSKPAFVTNALVNGDEVYCMLVDSGGCSTTPVPSNKITISVKDIPSIVLTPTDTTVEAGSSVRLNAAVSGNLQSYNWQPSSGLTGAGSLSPITLPVFSPAVYYFDAVTTDGCSINKKVSVSVFRNIVMPDAFTPNGDGFNDVFRIPPRTNLALTEFSIFDRNGYRVFTTADISKGWDGTINGIPQNTGWYIYVVIGKNSTGKIISKGSFVLVR